MGKKITMNGFFFVDNIHFHYRIPQDEQIFATKWQWQFVQIHTGDLNAISTALHSYPYTTCDYTLWFLKLLYK